MKIPFFLAMLVITCPVLASQPKPSWQLKDGKSLEREWVPGKYSGTHFITARFPDGRRDENFKKIECYSGSKDYEYECYPVPLPDSRFLLVDCFGHDAVSVSCRIVRFEKNGVLDTSFKPPFETSRDELINSPSSEIRPVDKVDVRENGKVCIHGGFISPLINWTQKDAIAERDRIDGLGDPHSKYGTLCLKENGDFESFKAGSSAAR